jgi:hypothetical protein
MVPAKPTPVVIGVNWYVEFDEPEKDAQGHYWIARDAKLSKVRGGHCVCLKPRGTTDPDAWWDFYNQGQEGACVGFGSSRMMSQLNRKTYDGFWLYHEAQKIDEWPGEDYDGTSVRAALDILRKVGHCVKDVNGTAPAHLDEGIAATAAAANSTTATTGIQITLRTQDILPAQTGDSPEREKNCGSWREPRIRQPGSA